MNKPTPASAYIRALTAARQTYRSLPDEIEHALKELFVLAKEGKLEDFDRIGRGIAIPMRQLAEAMQRRIEIGHEEVTTMLGIRRHFLGFAKELSVLNGDAERIQAIAQLEKLLDEFYVEGFLADVDKDINK